MVTGRPRRDLKYLFDRFDLWKYFEAIIDEDEVGDPNLRKPHPYPLHLCMEMLGAQEGLYIGDNNADWEMVYSYRKMYRKPVKFVHFKKVFQEDIPSDYSTDREEELKEIILKEVSQTRAEV